MSQCAAFGTFWWSFVIAGDRKLCVADFYNGRRSASQENIFHDTQVARAIDVLSGNGAATCCLLVNVSNAI